MQTCAKSNAGTFDYSTTTGSNGYFSSSTKQQIGNFGYLNGVSPSGAISGTSQRIGNFDYSNYTTPRVSGAAQVSRSAISPTTSLPGPTGKCTRELLRGLAISCTRRFSSCPGAILIRRASKRGQRIFLPPTSPTFCIPDTLFLMSVQGVGARCIPISRFTSRCSRWTTSTASDSVCGRKNSPDLSR